MKILLTGGSGFTGRHLLEQLSGRYELAAPRHSELDLLDTDAVSRFFSNNKIDIVVHAAIKPLHRNAKDTTDLLNSNLRMFFNIVRNRQYFGKMVFISSGAVYDMRHYRPKMKEEYFDEHVPCDDTGLYKYILAKHIEHMDNVVELRPFGLFGRNEDYAIRFISNMICKAIFDMPLTMKQNRRMDYLWVDDLPAIIEYFMCHDAKYKAYNVVPNEPCELYQLAQLVLKISGKDLPIIINTPGMGLEYTADNSRLHAEIPDARFTSIETSVRELYNWYKMHKDCIDKTVLLVDK